MSDIKVENYKKGVTHAVERWGEKLKKTAKKLELVDDALDKLQALKTPGPDEKKKIAELEKARGQIRAEVDKASTELRLDLMLLDVPEKADEKELLKLPRWLKDIIKAEGLPLGKDVSIAPDVDFDLKKFKLKSFGLTFKWSH